MRTAKLAKWMEKNGVTHQVMADDIGVARSLVTQWLNGYLEVDAVYCPTIERLTAGEVRCEDLQPDVEWSVLRRPRAA